MKINENKWFSIILISFFMVFNCSKRKLVRIHRHDLNFNSSPISKISPENIFRTPPAGRIYRIPPAGRNYFPNPTGRLFLLLNLIFFDIFGALLPVRIILDRRRHGARHYVSIALDFNIAFRCIQMQANVVRCNQIKDAVTLLFLLVQTQAQTSRRLGSMGGYHQNYWPAGGVSENNFGQPAAFGK